ncbi:porin [Cupriavidus pinatubonensis]|uniref:porin n=1 Tax=Cupriavidus pinatubonensis TaxID=248026 RepID=UPI0011263417|nr:porin [Cupriavidus pinatubonensis]TPQ33938.1 porin [Cupriavidus pinatubonensis]
MNVRTALGACAIALPICASAQSNATLYGVVDTGVAFVNGVGANRNTVTLMPGISGTVPSRWGLRGSEDLGGGNKALFWLESGFAPDTGVSNQGGRLFGRQALVGIAGNWGQIALGRQYTMLFYSMLDSELLGPNIFGSGSLDSYLPNARADNALSYKGKFGGLTVGTTYSFGRDTVNAGPSPAGTNCAGENPADQRACREWSAMLMYDAAKWNIGVAYDSQRGGPGAFGGLTSSSLKDDRLVVSGYVLVGQGKVAAGWLRRDNEGSKTPVSDMYWLGTSYPIAPAVSLDAEAIYQRFHNSDNKAWVLVGRTTYAFSKRTSLYGTVGYIINGGNLALSINSGQAGTNPAPGGNQLGLMAGLKHTF